MPHKTQGRRGLHYERHKTHRQMWVRIVDHRPDLAIEAREFDVANDADDFARNVVRPCRQ